MAVTADSRDAIGPLKATLSLSLSVSLSLSLSRQYTLYTLYILIYRIYNLYLYNDI